MAFGEIYTGLQAGVIDGLEHDAPTVLSAKFYETAKFFTLTRHIHNPFGAFVSDRSLQRMPATQRDGLLLAVRQATDDHFARAAQVENDALEELKGKGGDDRHLRPRHVPRPRQPDVGALRRAAAGREGDARRDPRDREGLTAPWHTAHPSLRPGNGPGCPARPLGLGSFAVC